MSEMNENESTIDLTITAPKNLNYEARLVRLNLDKEMEEDIKSGKGFMIDEPDTDKKAIDNGIKDLNSIYSPRFMKTIQDPDAYTDRYSCKCKKLQGKSYEGEVCPYCHTKVEYVGEDFEITGWIHLKDEYPIIHPNLFISLSKYIGASTFEAIVEPEIDLDENGQPVKLTHSSKLAKSQMKRRHSKTKIDSTFQGIGIIGLYNRFDEVMSYFHEKKKGKKDNIM